jgi:hypothetical protein
LFKHVAGIHVTKQIRGLEEPEREVLKHIVEHDTLCLLENVSSEKRMSGSERGRWITESLGRIHFVVGVGTWGETSKKIFEQCDAKNFT